MSVRRHRAQVDHYHTALAYKFSKGLADMFGTVAREKLVLAIRRPERIAQRLDASAKPPKLNPHAGRVGS